MNKKMVLLTGALAALAAFGYKKSFDADKAHDDIQSHSHVTWYCRGENVPPAADCTPDELRDARAEKDAKQAVRLQGGGAMLLFFVSGVFATAAAREIKDGKNTALFNRCVKAWDRFCVGDPKVAVPSTGGLCIWSKFFGDVSLRAAFTAQPGAEQDKFAIHMDSYLRKTTHWAGEGLEHRFYPVEKRECPGVYTRDEAMDILLRLEETRQPYSLDNTGNIRQLHRMLKGGLQETPYRAMDFDALTQKLGVAQKPPGTGLRVPALDHFG